MTAEEPPSLSTHEPITSALAGGAAQLVRAANLWVVVRARATADATSTAQPPMVSCSVRPGWPRTGALRPFNQPGFDRETLERLEHCSMPQPARAVATATLIRATVSVGFSTSTTSLL